MAAINTEREGRWFYFCSSLCHASKIQGAVASGTLWWYMYKLYTDVQECSSKWNCECL